MCSSLVMKIARRYGAAVNSPAMPNWWKGGRSWWSAYALATILICRPPVELISHIYQLFVNDAAVAVYTPHFVVRLMLGEVLS